MLQKKDLTKKDLTRAFPFTPSQLWLYSQLIFWGTALIAVAADFIGWTTFGIFDPHGSPATAPLAAIFFLWLVSLVALILAAVDSIRRHPSIFMVIGALGMVGGTVIVTGYLFGVSMLMLALFSGVPH